MRKFALLAIAFSVVIISNQEATAQRGGFDMTAWLKRLDQNENGKIDPEELEGRSGEFVKKMAERGGFKLDSAISIDDLSSKLRRAREDEREREGDRDDRDRDNRDDRDRDNRYVPKPLVPGFGEPMDGVELPPGFDVVPGALVNLEDLYEQKVIDYVDNIYDRYDKNDNSQLDPEEWGEIRWSSDPNASDVNNDGILTKEEFCERMVKRWGSGKLSKSSTSSSGSSSRSSSSSSSDESINERTRNYAASLIRLYDKDKNGSIDKKEQESMRGEWGGADKNNDGKLDEREIAAKLANYSKDSSSRSSRSWGSKRSEDDDRGKRSYATASSAERKTYRASTPDEKLPKGLPDWFTRNDANGDGQVQMSEYAAAWSDSRAEEFFTIDTNGDGFITPTEAVEGGSSGGSSSSDSRSSTSSYRRSSTGTPTSESRYSRFRSR